ncbi:MAG: bifunctional enoyl-CoA hydratase/phosphate acetyltransferase, partial [Dethiosulfatibacter sp.]|nr:bifunctional enoyl-CoA hydratase/phosphate acetyltransferase [Dethiosulfatibacter sp.]
LDNNLITPILIGDRTKIQSLSHEIGLDLANISIIESDSAEKSAYIAASLVNRKEAQAIMKGFLDTSVILKAILNKDFDLIGNQLISHVGVIKVKNFDRFFILSDSAININPTLEEKIMIIENAVNVAHALGIETPKVALICPVEKVNPKIQATVDAETITRMNKEGVIKRCIVRGPLALDNAVSAEAAIHKGIENPVAGKADVLIPPDLSSANILNKSMEYFAEAEKAGILMGAKVPIILTSRASSPQSKLNSIALGILCSNQAL